MSGNLFIEGQNIPSGRPGLNLQGFTNQGVDVRRVVTLDQANSLIQKGEIEVFTPAAIKAFAGAIDEMTTQATKKALDPSAAADLEKAISDFKSLQQVYVETDQALEPVFFRPVQASALEFMLRQPTVTDKIEKGEVMDAFRNDNVAIKKKGKDIKAQIAAILPTYAARQQGLKAQLDALYASARVKPSSPCSDYMYGGFKMQIPAIVRYDYALTRIPEQTMPGVPAERDPYMPNYKAEDYPQNEEEAASRRLYNDSIYAYLEACTDSCTLQLLANHLTDGETYTLTFRQLSMLGFS